MCTCTYTLDAAFRYDAIQNEAALSSFADFVKGNKVLTEALSNRDATYTVFAPDNEAMQAAETFLSSLKAEEVLSAVLAHVLPDFTYSVANQLNERVSHDTLRKDTPLYTFRVPSFGASVL